MRTVGEKMTEYQALVLDLLAEAGIDGEAIFCGDHYGPDLPKDILIRAHPCKLEVEPWT